MRRLSRHLALLGICFMLVMATACGSCVFFSAKAPADQAEAPPKPKPIGKTVAVARDLEQDEAAGGHTLSRHVGQSDEELRRRLQRERISAASTYTDRVAAESAVGIAISSHRDKIRQWLSHSGGHPNLVLDYDFPRPIGSTLLRNEPHSMPCLHAIVVLKWKPPADYYVLTSYPECK
jgi:Bacterial CdiA-CT RNAse A domain